MGRSGRASLILDGGSADSRASLDAYKRKALSGIEPRIYSPQLILIAVVMQLKKTVIHKRCCRDSEARQFVNYYLHVMLDK
jgi:hypothetical protein